MAKYTSSVNSSGQYGNIGIDITLQNKDEPKKEEISRFICNLISDAHDKLIAFLSYQEAKEQWVEELKFFQSLLPNCEHKELPNGYTRGEYAEPWYYFYTNRGPLTIGWRKRVINLSWSDFPEPKSAHELFPNEDVTKGDFYIHAHSHEKLKEYVTKVMKEHKR